VVPSSQGFTKDDRVTLLIIHVFIEQPLALPRSDKKGDFMFETKYVQIGPETTVVLHEQLTHRSGQDFVRCCLTQYS
jgi:hypothetical protein